MTTKKTLIFIPTYNERENAGRICDQILALNLDADLIFMDDNSPDGTGEILENLAKQHPKVSVLHRAGKLGIGSAHLDGIAWAYDHGYEQLITMDCDFTHSPADLPKLRENSVGYDVTVGSRYLCEDSLPGWNLLRRSLTNLGHFLTKNLLKISCDATGAFRIYDLQRIPRELFGLVTARGYAFFFESLFLIQRNGFSINEFPIVLPARTYGHSKMTVREAWRSASQLLSLYAADYSNPERFRMGEPVTDLDPNLIDPQNWDPYWERKERPITLVYDLIASVYRRGIIKRQLERSLTRHFSDGARLLHAGCGSGQVDMELAKRMKITAVDISPAALQLYRRNNLTASEVKHASILSLPFDEGSYDGVYNLGVVEHFTAPEIGRILAEFYRVLRPGGKIVIFWPHARASSVWVLKGSRWVLNRVLKEEVQFHPAEISLLRSKAEAEAHVRSAGLRLVDYDFGIRDFFLQAIIVAQKN